MYHLDNIQEFNHGQKFVVVLVVGLFVCLFVLVFFSARIDRLITVRRCSQIHVNAVPLCHSSQNLSHHTNRKLQPLTLSFLPLVCIPFAIVRGSLHGHDNVLGDIALYGEQGSPVVVLTSIGKKRRANLVVHWVHHWTVQHCIPSRVSTQQQI